MAERCLQKDAKMGTEYWSFEKDTTNIVYSTHLQEEKLLSHALPNKIADAVFYSF